MENKDNWENPCDTCLVQACCSEMCAKFSKFIDDVLNMVKEYPKEENALHTFSEEQKKLIRSTAATLRKRMEIEDKQKNKG